MTGDVLLGRNLYAMGALEERVGQVIRQLPLRGSDGTYLIDDEALRTTVIAAESGAKALWRLGCAARAEIVRRITERAQDSTVIAREIAREAAEQHVSPRTLRRDAAIGRTFGPLFTEPDSAPDMDRVYYSVALRAPDPCAALVLAQARKDENPFYSAHDFEAEVARARMADPVAGYGPASEGRCGLAYVWPYWDEGVLEASEKALALPLRRWMLPDAVILVHTPPRALDLSMRIMAAHDVRYQTTVIVPTPPYRDGCAWHEHDMVVCGTMGKLRLSEGVPGTWRDAVMACIDRYFPFAGPKLVVYPRRSMAVYPGFATPIPPPWATPEDLPDGIR